MKYEYMLHTWGGFYNREYRYQHGHMPGYRWFDTREERAEYINMLRKAEEMLQAHHLVVDVYEGTNTRLKTCALITFKYKWKKYRYTWDFGYCYPEESARFMLEEGNYSCDCNRSIALQKQYKRFKELPCGNKIKIIKMKIVRAVGTYQKEDLENN